MMKIGFLKGEKLFLALDIGTECIKALVFKKRKEKYIILKNALHYLDKFGTFDSFDFEPDILKKTILQVIKELKTKEVNSILVGLPPNILKGEIVFQEFSRKNPKSIITKKEEAEILNTILYESRKKISQQLSKKIGLLPQDLQFLDSKILEIKIDGYSVPKLEGYRGKSLNFRIVFTFLPKYYFENFKKNLSFLQFYGKIKITSIVRGLILAFQIEDALFLDIGGEITQIFLIKGGKLERISGFEIGGKNFSQILTESLGLPLFRARILKERYASGFLSEGVRKRIREKFLPLAKDWFSNLKLKLNHQKFLPPKIFLFGGGSSLPEIQEILGKGDWEEFAVGKKPKVKLLYPKDLKNIEDKTKKLISPQIIPTLFIGYGQKENF